ncbi:hypothetical protein ABZ297_09010 [Nonomuraea sp. NPDC005983]|uniref:hypothetical protein n=1 Tax=Nonomuraea sp. NPDC005983 TaxID=3155595 RepID=UPI0033B9FEFD
MKFKQGKLESNGKKLTGDSENVGGLANRTKGINLAWPGYGLTGRDAAAAHAQARAQHIETLKVARKVLESWRDALKVADDKYTKADEDSGSGIDKLGLGNKTPTIPASLGNLGNPNFGNPNVNTPDLKDPNLNTPDLKDPNLNTPDLKDPNLKNPNLNTPDLKDPNLNNPNLNDPRLNDPNLKTPDLNNPDLNNPKINDPNLKTPDLKQPDLSGLDPSKTNLPDPTKTDLSSLNPSDLQTPQIRTPEGVTTTDPGRMTAGGPGAGYGGGSAAGGTPPNMKLPSGLSGGNGMGGMPFMPMTPMSGAGDKEKEGTGSDKLHGDEDDWGAGEDAAPAVLRHEGI